MLNGCQVVLCRYCVLSGFYCVARVLLCDCLCVLRILLCCYAVAMVF